MGWYLFIVLSFTIADFYPILYHRQRKRMYIEKKREICELCYVVNRISFNYEFRLLSCFLYRYRHCMVSRKHILKNYSKKVEFFCTIWTINTARTKFYSTRMVVHINNVYPFCNFVTIFKMRLKQTLPIGYIAYEFIFVNMKTNNKC